MKISPIKSNYLLNNNHSLNISHKNKQISVNNSLQSVSTETMRTYYRPIAFKGKDNSDENNKIKFSEETIKQIKSAFKMILSGPLDDENFEKMSEGITEEELFDILNTTDKDNDKVVFWLAFTKTYVFAQMAKPLSKENRISLLKISNERNDSVAHYLAINPELYTEITKDFTPEEQFEILTLADEDKITVAHKLANNMKAYLKATQGLSEEKQDYISNLTDKRGTSVKQILEE